MAIIENETKYLIRNDSRLLSDLWNRVRLSGSDAAVAIIHQYYPFGNVGRVRRRQWVDQDNGFVYRDLIVDLDKRVWPVSDVMYSITHKHTLQDQNGNKIPLEFEADLNHDEFVKIMRAYDSNLEPACKNMVSKLRFLISDSPYHWDIDFFPSKDNPEAGFVMGIAECEMPEGMAEPTRIPEILQPYLIGRTYVSNYQLATDSDLFSEMAIRSQS